MPRQTLKRWGNSLAVRIPANVAQEAHVVEGQEVEVYVQDGQIRIRPYAKLRRFSRERYLQQLREASLVSHPLIDFGELQGDEFERE